MSDADTTREWAEAAGLKWSEDRHEWTYWEPECDPHESWRGLEPDDPALIPLIAERLANIAQETVGWPFSAYPQPTGQWVIHALKRDFWGV